VEACRCLGCMRLAGVCLKPQVSRAAGGRLESSVPSSMASSGKSLQGAAAPRESMEVEWEVEADGTADLHKRGEPARSVVERDTPGAEPANVSSLKAVKAAQRSANAGADDHAVKGEDDEDGEPKGADTGVGKNSAEDELARLAQVFFDAATKPSTDNEDILPQEDSEEMQLSVFNIFAGLFPETVGEHGASVKNKRLRLHFNKIGYHLYSKEQSRRVPAVRAKPGNPGYGFRRARWRSTGEETDRRHCETVLRSAGCSEERISAVLETVQDTCERWDSIRRPSRPAGPGRPRRPEDGGPSAPSTPALKPVSQKVAGAKTPKSGAASKKQAAATSERGTGDKIAMSLACSDEERPGRGPATAKSKAVPKGKGSGCKSRKEKFGGRDVRDDNHEVPNLVKDEASPLLAASSWNARGSEVQVANRSDTAGPESAGPKRRSAGLEGPGGYSKRLKMAARPGFKDSAHGRAGDLSRALAASFSPSLAFSTQTDDATLPPLKLGEAMVAAGSHDAARKSLPSFESVNQHSFSGLEQLASLASSSEKLVTVSTSQGDGPSSTILCAEAARLVP